MIAMSAALQQVCKLGAMVESCTEVVLRMLQAMNMIEHEEDIYARPARTWFQVRHRSPCLRPCLDTLNCMTRCLGVRTLVWLPAGSHYCDANNISMSADEEAEGGSHAAR